MLMQLCGIKEILAFYICRLSFDWPGNNSLMYTSSINNIVDINILDSIEPKPQLENSGLNNGAKTLQESCSQ